jgi:hypothetical protein
VRARNAARLTLRRQDGKNGKRKQHTDETPPKVRRASASHAPLGLCRWATARFGFLKFYVVYHNATSSIGLCHLLGCPLFVREEPSTYHLTLGLADDGRPSGATNDSCNCGNAGDTTEDTTSGSVVDTREQVPLDFSRFEGWFAGIKRKALKLGIIRLPGREDIAWWNGRTSPT